MRAVELHAGERFGSLVVDGGRGFLGEGRRKRAAYECRCDCGERVVIRLKHLRSGHTKSCGCLVLRHGGVGTRLYTIWKGMRSRCETPSSSNYARYGGRGIRVCAEWQHFEVFRDWANANGYRDDLQIDRLDNDRGYEPGNCRWVTPRENTNNRGVTRKLEAFGETKPFGDWARDDRCAVSAKRLNKRIARGWDAERALCTPAA